ncbi:MAG: hypothetical protein LBM23_11015 [Propionibacteriaceae bacterium]|nr:hypothetical protein [Propionibacteriaceae bacterium]
MPRPSKHHRPARPLSASFGRVDVKRDGEWVLRTISGSQATKEYRCPGCGITISPGVPHVVTWPRVPAIGTTATVDERRHWHTACWGRRP